MDITLFKPEDFVKSQWSGGTTTELFIFPATATYALRDFSFRLSSAKIEAEISEFTSLPGISRKLMILNGEIKIQHENHHSKLLKKFDHDAFEGDWKTTSHGRCTDFNLMTTGDTSGELNALTFKESSSQILIVDNYVSWLFFYALKGSVILKIHQKTYDLPENCMIVVRNYPKGEIEINSLAISDLILCKIN